MTLETQEMQFILQLLMSDDINVKGSQAFMLAMVQQKLHTIVTAKGEAKDDEAGEG